MASKKCLLFCTTIAMQMLGVQQTWVKDGLKTSVFLKNIRHLILCQIRSSDVTLTSGRSFFRLLTDVDAVFRDKSVLKSICQIIDNL